MGPVQREASHCPWGHWDSELERTLYYWAGQPPNTPALDSSPSQWCCKDQTRSCDCCFLKCSPPGTVVEKQILRLTLLSGSQILVICILTNPQCRTSGVRYSPYFDVPCSGEFLAECCKSIFHIDDEHGWRLVLSLLHPPGLGRGVVFLSEARSLLGHAAPWLAPWFSHCLLFPCVALVEICKICWAGANSMPCGFSALHFIPKNKNYWKFYVVRKKDISSNFLSLSKTGQTTITVLNHSPVQGKDFIHVCDVSSSVYLERHKISIKS